MEITGDFTNNLYESYLYLNPNYANKRLYQFMIFPLLLKGLHSQK